MSDFTPHEAPVHSAQEIPAVQPGKLIGRETALAQIYSQLKENRPVLIHGPTGAGKTAIAVTLANAYAQQPGGVLWIRANDPSLETLLVQVGRAFQVRDITNSDNPLGMVGAVENTLKQNKPFVVIDGVISEEVASRFINRCVSGIPLLIATESKLEGSWAILEIEPLEPDPAAALFKQTGRLTSDEHDIDVHGITKFVNYLPFGIKIAALGMLASKKTPSDFLKQMQQVSEATGGKGPVAALATSFKGLNGALQGLVLMMGATFNGEAGTELLSMVSNAPVETVQQAMNILTQLNFLQRIKRYDDFYYQLHPLTYAFAQASLKGSNRLDELQTKTRDKIVEYAQKHSQSSSEDFDKLAMEIETILAAARWSIDKGEREAVNDLATALMDAGNFIGERGYLYEQLQLRELSRGSSGTAFPAHPPEESIPFPDDEEDEDDNEFAVDEDALEDVEDDDLEATFFSNAEEESDPVEGLAVRQVAFDLTSEDISALRSMLAQVKQSGDQAKQLEVLKRIGELQVEQGMENEAIATHNEALSIYEEQENQTGILAALDMLSALMVKTENSQAAVLHASRGIKMADEVNDLESKMHLLQTLGDARQQLGESDVAIEDYGSALSIARTRDDQQNEAIVLYKLGYAQLDDGDPETAIETWEQALKLFKEQEKRDYEGRTLGGLGSAYGDLQRWAEAVNFHTSALHIAREVGDEDEESLQLSSLGYAATQAGQLGEAVLRYRQALHLAYQMDDVDNIVSTIVDLSRLLLQSKRHILVAELLINDALENEPHDRDVKQLQERVETEKSLAEEYGTNFVEVSGTAQDYAENAYKLLEG
jgi:tetratricopeptide (TPR) repeat protein/energy-coupling factor transporter ATP-binding protein EcfA2